MDGLMEREWRTISQYPNYEVSNCGEIRHKETKRLRKLRKNHFGYIDVVVKCNKKKKVIRVHRAVANAFIPNPLNKPCVNHKDFNRANNRVDNLEWVTYSENQYWSSENSRKARLGKKRGSFSLEAKRNISRGRNASQNRPYPHYIHKTPYGYRFLVRRDNKIVASKYGKTLEEVIAFMSNWVKENKETFYYL